LIYFLDEKRKFIHDDFILDENNEDNEIVLVKMNKKMRDIRDGKPDAGDNENDVDDVEDIHLELNSTFHADDELIDLLHGPTSKLAPSEIVLEQVEQIAKTRSKAKEKQTKQANQMLAHNKKAINSFKVGDLVLLPVDSHDLGSADAPNLECIILEKIGDNQFRLGHISGVLKECVTYNVLTKLSDKSSNFTIDKVPMDKRVSVREAVKAVSISGGQGVKACNCSSGNCNGGKCGCFLNKIPCNSRCHKGNPNPNCLRPSKVVETGKEANTEKVSTGRGRGKKKLN